MVIIVSLRLIKSNKTNLKKIFSIILEYFRRKLQMNIIEHNKNAWNNYVEKKNQWTIPVSSEVIQKARDGNFEIVLTPVKPVPKDWFPAKLNGSKVLALASGGGQQGPVLAAAGADVTVFDNSPNQLAMDRLVADREKLEIKTIEGNMLDLSCFSPESFDFIFHPCSNSFVPDVKKVWKEAYRVLKKGGTMISGFSNPIIFITDLELEKAGIVQLKYKIPFSDLDFSDAERENLFGKDEPLSFGHSLEDQINGQIEAGFVIAGFYEDKWDEKIHPVSKHMNCFIATKALKL